VNVPTYVLGRISSDVSAYMIIIFIVGRFHPFLQATKALRENIGIAPLCFWTSALEGGEGSASRPGRILPPGKTRYPMYRRLGGPQGRSGQVRKISPPQGFDPQTVQPVPTEVPGPLIFIVIY
jgi:hypothetical protein